VGPGVQRAVSAPGPRFYQVRLQCAKEVWNNQATSVFPSLSTSVSSSADGIGSGAPQFNAVAPIALGVTGSTTFNVNQGGTASYRVDSTNPATLTVTLLATNPITVSFSAAGSTFSAFLPTSSTTINQTGPQVTQFSAQLGITGTFSISGPPAQAAGASASATFLVGPVNLTLVIPNQTFSYTASFSTSFSTSTSTAGTPANAAGFEISQGATGTCRAEFDKEPATGTGAGPITTARGPRLDITFTVPR